VLLLEVLEPVQEPEFVLRDVAWALKPGGVLVATVPFLDGIYGYPQDYWRCTLVTLGLPVNRVGPAASFSVLQTTNKGGLMLAIAALLANLSEATISLGASIPRAVVLWVIAASLRLVVLPFLASLCLWHAVRPTQTDRAPGFMLVAAKVNEERNA
jgi:hypothetical protein